MILAIYALCNAKTITDLDEFDAVHDALSKAF